MEATMSATGALKRKWHAWLDKMSESNKRQFGADVPDCCRMMNKGGHGKDHGSPGGTTS